MNANQIISILSVAILLAMIYLFYIKKDTTPVENNKLSTTVSNTGVDSGVNSGSGSGTNSGSGSSTDSGSGSSTDSGSTLPSTGTVISLRIYSRATPLTSSTLDFKVSTGWGLQLTADGDLVIKNKDGVVVWQTFTSGNKDAKLVMETDGTISLYKSDGVTKIWKTGVSGYEAAIARFNALTGEFYIYKDTVRVFTIFDPAWLKPYSTDVIRFRQGIVYTSVNFPENIGIAYGYGSNSSKITFTSTGKLSILNVRGVELWTRGGGAADAKLCMQPDGNLVILNGTSPIWSSDTSNNYGAYAEFCASESTFKIYDKDDVFVKTLY